MFTSVLCVMMKKMLIITLTTFKNKQTNKPPSTKEYFSGILSKTILNRMRETAMLKLMPNLFGITSVK